MMTRLLDKKKNLFNRFSCDEKGVAATEFALMLPFFLFVLFAVIEFSMVLLAKAELDAGVQEAARVASTGKKAAETQQQFLQKIADVINQHVSRWGTVKAEDIKPEVYPSFSTVGTPEPYIDTNNNGEYDQGEAYTDANGNGQWDEDRGAVGTGASGEIVLYDITLNYNFLIPGYIGTTLPLNSSVVVRNEPF
ncbi:MAG: TadE/TadG family type IV pilus assembly protein [Alphaproteobacteria bacterium]